MTDACAQIVQRDDPHLYATALFAPEPARSRLMVLYAFDIELSRAIRASAESLIPRMRLQFWRDVIAEAEQGKPPKAHEVAGPLADLVRASRDRHPPWNDQNPFEGIVDGYERELGAPFSDKDFQAWRVERFQSLARLELAALCGDALPPPETAHLYQGSAKIRASAFALRQSVPMAARGAPTLLPDMPPAAYADLCDGTMSAPLQAIVGALAAEAAADLKRERELQTERDRRTLPMFLPLIFAERIVAPVNKHPDALFSLGALDRPFDGLRLAWRAARGRW